MAPPVAQITPPASKSRPRPLPLGSRAVSRTSQIYMPVGPDALLPDGSVGDVLEATELLKNIARPQHGTHNDITVDPEQADVNPDDEDRRVSKDSEKPWYKRPNPLWILCFMPFTAIAMASTIAPRVEIYTELACRELKPEYTVGRGPSPLDNLFWNPFGNIADQGRMGSGLPPLWSSIGGSSPLNPSPVLGNSPSTNGTAPDKKKKNICAADPEVQAAVAKLTATMSSMTGVLGCLTTGWWGSFSDRHGRVAVMGITAIGLLVSDFNFIFVSFFSTKLPGGYWFLILGPIVDGCVGGLTSAAAAMHAYVADCTEPAARSRIFSLSLGLLFTGLALGPTLGALLIRVTHHTLSVFYFASAMHVLYSLFVWLIMPESLSERAMLASRKRRVDDVADAIRAEREEAEAGGGRGVQLMMRFKRFFGFLSPLAVFAPRSLDRPAAPGKNRGKDWSLTLLVLSYAFSKLIMSSYSYKFQYAAATFDWSSEEMGYWLSLIGTTRALYLTLVLPVLIKLYTKFRPPAIQLPTEPLEPLHSTNPQASPATAIDKEKKKKPLSLSFDLGLARMSLALEVVCYTLIPLAPSALSFTVFSMLGSFGAGYDPAAQALALALFARSGETETGRLFGALSVVQVTCTQIVGPALFGITYMKTVATYPKTIFFLSAACCLVAFVFIMFVRIPKETPVAQDPEGVRPGVDQEYVDVEG